MNLAQAGRLLDPKPMPLETGFERLESGVLHVAVRTDMHRCTGAMLDWWFGTRMNTQHYVWWHPIDHIASSWIEGASGTAVGAIHLAEERFTDRPAEQLSIQFRDPVEVFDAQALANARQAGGVSCVLVARGGQGHPARRTPDGAVIGTRLIHVGRDTPWGMALRTHFFLGHDLAELGMPRSEIEHIFPDVQGPNLLQHAYDEFTFLSRFLPSLYAAENRETIPVKAPW